MGWTTTDLLSTIKNREMFPDASTGSLSSDTLLEFATEELYITLVPMILGAREKYYETSTTFNYTTSTTTRDIPQRSIGGTIALVQYSYGTYVYPLEPIDPREVSTTTPSAQPVNFYFQNNSIVFYPPPNANQGTITLRYFQRPSRLALTSECAQITAVDTNTGVVTAVVPMDWTQSNTFDFIPNVSAQATPYGLDSTVSSISGTSMTFVSLPAAAAVGDWIALSNYTPIPEIPFEFQPVLAQATAVRALGAINDATGLVNAKQDLAMFMQSAIKLLTPRNTEGLKKVVSGWRNF